MTLFPAIDVGRTGIGFARYWMDVLAHNMANVNTVREPDEEPFRARQVFARALTDQIAPTGSGVGVGAVLEDDAQAPMVYEPDHTLADDEGYVTMPVVDLAGQLADLIIASRTYQANLKTIDTGRQAYEAALRLGQR